jgi:hypothetical protein
VRRDGVSHRHPNGQLYFRKKAGVPEPIGREHDPRLTSAPGMEKQTDKIVVGGVQGRGFLDFPALFDPIENGPQKRAFIGQSVHGLRRPILPAACGDEFDSGGAEKQDQNKDWILPFEDGPI